MTVEAVHRGKGKPPALHKVKDTVEEGNVEVEHIVLEVYGSYAQSAYLRNLIFDSAYRPPAVRGGRLAAEGALERTSS